MQVVVIGIADVELEDIIHAPGGGRIEARLKFFDDGAGVGHDRSLYGVNGSSSLFQTNVSYKSWIDCHPSMR
ncbi:hypothetical protein GCM10027512_21870 [Chromohalobacter beijerinckii]